jgi:hypothetical protein
MIAEGQRRSALLRNGRFTSLPRFQLGDRVLVEPNKTEGIIVGVRYGELAYDVLCGFRVSSQYLTRTDEPRVNLIFNGGFGYWPAMTQVPIV